MTRPLHLGMQLSFVATEAVAWFLVLRVFATTVERGAFAELADSIEAGLRLGAFTDQLAAANALEVARSASESVHAGPSLVIVMITALGAYWLARGITEARLGSAGTLVGVIVSVLALNGLLHIVLAGDIRIWDSTGLARFIDDPQSPFVGDIVPQAFVQTPDRGSVEGVSLIVVVMGMLGLWLRFLLAGRRTLIFDRALRSFSFGFPFVLIAAFVAAVNDQGVGILALLYFVLGVLTLAIANAARSADQGRELTRVVPWATSLLITLGVLGGVAMAFGLLAYLEVERALAPVGGAVLALIELALVIVLTPAFLFLDWLFGLLGAPDLNSMLEALQRNQELLDTAAEEAEDAPLQIPGWVGGALRLALAAFLTVGGFWIARFLFRRAPQQEPSDYEEMRASVDASVDGMGRMLRNLLPGARRRSDRANWTDRHAVYRLFGRVVGDSDERGFPRRAGETPLEFATVAGRTLDATAAFGDIADAFDRARYGRHYGGDDEMSALEGALSRWEQTHPATAEWRREVAREEAQEELVEEADVTAPRDKVEGPDQIGPM